MTSLELSNVAWLTATRDVAVLQWPAEATEADRLNREGTPHLLLVAEGAAPPVTGSCLEDWLSLPTPSMTTFNKAPRAVRLLTTYSRPEK